MSIPTDNVIVWVPGLESCYVTCNNYSLWHSNSLKKGAALSL